MGSDFVDGDNSMSETSKYTKQYRASTRFADERIKGFIELYLGGQDSGTAGSTKRICRTLCTWCMRDCVRILGPSRNEANGKDVLPLRIELSCIEHRNTIPNIPIVVDHTMVRQASETQNER